MINGQIESEKDEIICASLCIDLVWIETSCACLSYIYLNE